MRDTVTVSAPGSIMLAGEHAVLHGYPALVAAVDRRMQVRFARRSDDRVRILSALGTYEQGWDTLRPEVPFTFILSALEARREEIGSGLDIEVTSAFSDKVGLGSSAAVTVAAHAAISALAGAAAPPEALFLKARETIRLVQGRGSGADAAASALGGVVSFVAEAAALRPLDALPPVVLLYCGYKESTASVIAKVEAARSRDAEKIDAVLAEIGAGHDPVVDALEKKDWPRLGHLLDTQHELMKALGVCNSDLDRLVAELRACPRIHGAKISGSGLGDCVWGLGEAADDVAWSGERIDVRVSRKGVQLEDD